MRVSVTVSRSIIISHSDIHHFLLSSTTTIVSIFAGDYNKICIR